MLSRALSLATVILIGCFAAGVVRAQNLDAGKSPSQIFSGTCSACHKSPRGLLKNTPVSSLPGFLRQHYTTGSDMASVLSSYLIANGAADPRYQAKDQPRQKDAKQDGRSDQPDRFGRRQPPSAPAQEANRPGADGAPPQGEAARPGRDAKRLARPHTAPEAARPADGQATTDSKSGVRQKQGRRGRPAAEEPPKAEEAARGDAAKEDASRDAAKSETAKPGTAKPDLAEPDRAKPDPTKTDSGGPDPAKPDTDRTDSAKGEADKPAPEAAKPAGESDKPASESGSETAKINAPKESTDSEPTPPRPDPVTPAPSAPAANVPEPHATAPATSPLVTAPATPAAVPVGPPAPPISR